MAKAIRAAVVHKEMPPWDADPKYGKFFERPFALASRRSTRWWRGSRAARSKGTRPTLRSPSSSSRAGRSASPTRWWRPPKPFEVPASGAAIEYQYVIFPSGFTEDKWIERSRCGQGTPPSSTTSTCSRAPGGKPFAPARARQGTTSSRPSPRNDPEPFSFCDERRRGAPWLRARRQPHRLRAGSGAPRRGRDRDIVTNSTTRPGGTEAFDTTKVGFVFAEKPPTEAHHLGHGAELQLHHSAAAPTTKRGPRRGAAQRRRRVDVDAAAHASAREEVRVRACYPDGLDETLVSVAEVRLQLADDLCSRRGPKMLPKGARLEWIGLVRRTNREQAANPDPNALVIYGEQTWNEMMGGVIDLAVDPGAGVGQEIFKRVPGEARSGSPKSVAGSRSRRPAEPSDVAARGSLPFRSGCRCDQDTENQQREAPRAPRSCARPRWASPRYSAGPTVAEHDDQPDQPIGGAGPTRQGHPGARQDDTRHQRDQQGLNQTPPPHGRRKSPETRRPWRHRPRKERRAQSDLERSHGRRDHRVRDSGPSPITRRLSTGGGGARPSGAGRRRQLVPTLTGSPRRLQERSLPPASRLHCKAWLSWNNSPLGSYAVEFIDPTNAGRLGFRRDAHGHAAQGHLLRPPRPRQKSRFRRHHRRDAGARHRRQRRHLTVVDGMMLEALPYRDAPGIVRIWDTKPRRGGTRPRSARSTSATGRSATVPSRTSRSSRTRAST